MKRIFTVIAGACLATTFAILGTGPAFAAGPGGGVSNPCPTPTSTNGVPNSGSGTKLGGSCAVPATLSVTSQLAIATDFTAITVYQTAALAAAGGQPGTVYVQSNDGSGYYVSEQSSQFTGPATVPNSAINGTQFSGTTAASVPFGSVPLQFSASPNVSGSIVANNAPGGNPGWDEWGVNAFALNSSAPTVPAGTYNGTVTFALWGN